MASLRQKLGTVFWAVKTTFLMNPVFLIVSFTMGTALQLWQPVQAVYLGRAVNIFNGISGGGINTGELITTLIILCGIRAFAWIWWSLYTVAEAASRMPINIKTDEKIICMTQNIPIKNFDDSDFCGRYQFARDGFDRIPRIGSQICGFTGAVIGFTASIIVILKTAVYIFPLIAVSLVISCILNMKSEKARYNFQRETTNANRFSGYLAGLFCSKQNAKEIRAYTMRPFLYDRWSAVRGGIRTDSFALERRANNLFSGFHLFTAASNFVVLAVLIVLAGKGLTAIGSVITIWKLTENMLWDVRNIASQYAGLYYDNEKIARAKEFWDAYGRKQTAARGEKTSPGNRTADAAANAAVNAAANAGTVIDLRNVSFAYKGGKDALKDVTLSIKKGESVALVGENGSGKSTLVKVILGLYAPDSGGVYLAGTGDGAPLKASIGKAVGVAFQDYQEYPFTLRENIGFGYIDEMDNDEKIRAAAEKGEALYLVERHGIDKIVKKALDENGVDLSGGEWQRLALSRANMNDKPLLIFDEPAAKLDPLAELNQFSHIQEMLKDRTAILISHRIGFARLAKRILVMKDGRIIEDGTHGELSALRGEYKRMLDEQAQWYDLAWEAKA
ncbi:MAG: ABC transporter ATP-binding protein/permease [Treponema sp.]|nr:ABC transporter ATP-binding protein/permease [Treponema sp.]